MKQLLLAGILTAVGLSSSAVFAQVSDSPDTPFKLATFERNGAEQVGILIGERLFDLQAVNTAVTEQAGLPRLQLPADMRALIESADTAMPRLFQIANYMGSRAADSSLGLSPDDVRIVAPIKYPWNLLAAGQNYRAHAAEMGGADDIDPDADDPFLFAKSPRSTIIGTGQAFEIPPGIDTIDWEGEFAVVMGRESRNLTLDNALDNVFGFTIVYDLSDRDRQITPEGRYERNWFAGKSLDHAAPMGPYVVPKEFLPNYASLRLVTRINGEVMQDSDTSYLIHDVEHILRYATSVMTLWPGDVIATGTPEGVGRGRTPPVYLKPGDLVEIEIEGIGTLVTPIK